MSALVSTCAHCGEPIVKVESPFDNIWRWRHDILGVIRTHVATPVHVNRDKEDIEASIAGDTGAHARRVLVRLAALCTESSVQEHHPRCLSLTDGDLRNICDCDTLRLLGVPESSDPS